jgi:hypothetical protein
MAKKKRRHKGNWVYRNSRGLTLGAKRLRPNELGQQHQHFHNVSAAEVAKLWRSEKAKS